MAFAKPLAKTGLFGLAGLAASGAFKKNKNKNPATQTNPSLIARSTAGVTTPSLMNSTKPSLY
jgi:hypothetical protein